MSEQKTLGQVCHDAWYEGVAKWEECPYQGAWDRIAETIIEEWKRRNRVVVPEGAAVYRAAPNGDYQHVVNIAGTPFTHELRPRIAPEPSLLEVALRLMEIDARGQMKEHIADARELIRLCREEAK